MSNCPTCGWPVATVEEATAGRARYDDTQGGHSDRHTLVVEAAEHEIAPTPCPADAAAEGSPAASVAVPTRRAPASGKAGRALTRGSEISMTDRQFSPRNTTRDAQENPLTILAASLGSGGVSQAIEEQERNGQAEVLNSTTLPTEGSNDPALLELGFTFGDRVAGDPLFRQATLPAGWTREGSDHAMHSYICDERGVRRVNVFYKAAFYDRRADLHILNVGNSLATEWIYGDDPKPTLRADLTDDERADVLASAEHYISRAAEHPDIYGDRLGRAKALAAEVDR